jgi:hypothetical protein
LKSIAESRKDGAPFEVRFPEDVDEETEVLITSLVSLEYQALNVVRENCYF